MQDVADRLTEQYPWKKFTFGTTDKETWGFRYLISCILVGGSLEEKTIECANELFEKYPDIGDLANADMETIAQIICSHGVRFHGPKSKHIVATANLVLNKYNGRVPDERAKLGAFPGVGRHVASVILATVYEQNEFAVDVHVRRIAGRLGIGGTDLQIEKEIVKAIKPEMLGHFSRAFVDFGQTKCAATPDCTGCNFANICNVKSTTIKLKPKSKSTVLDFENYSINAVQEGDVVKIVFQKTGATSTCTVRRTAHKQSCSCRGYRFRKKCKHLKMAKEYS